jgi:hypothetical protein
MSAARERSRRAINESRELWYEIACRDELQAYVTGTNTEHGSAQEAIESVERPAPATDADIDAHIAGLAKWAADIRGFVAKGGDSSEPYVRARLLVRAEEIEDRVAQLVPADALREAS